MKKLVLIILTTLCTSSAHAAESLSLVRTSLDTARLFIMPRIQIVSEHMSRHTGLYTALGAAAGSALVTWWMRPRHNAQLPLDDAATPSSVENKLYTELARQMRELRAQITELQKAGPAATDREAKREAADPAADAIAAMQSKIANVENVIGHRIKDNRFPTIHAELFRLSQFTAGLNIIPDSFTCGDNQGLVFKLGDGLTEAYQRLSALERYVDLPLEDESIEASYTWRIGTRSALQDTKPAYTIPLHDCIRLQSDKKPADLTQAIAQRWVDAAHDNENYNLFKTKFGTAREGRQEWNGKTFVGDTTIQAILTVEIETPAEADLVSGKATKSYVQCSLVCKKDDWDYCSGLHFNKDDLAAAGIADGARNVGLPTTIDPKQCKNLKLMSVPHHSLMALPKAPDREYAETIDLEWSHVAEKNGRVYMFSLNFDGTALEVRTCTTAELEILKKQQQEHEEHQKKCEAGDPVALTLERNRHFSSLTLGQPAMPITATAGPCMGLSPDDNALVGAGAAREERETKRKKASTHHLKPFTYLIDYLDNAQCTYQEADYCITPKNQSGQQLLTEITEYYKNGQYWKDVSRIAQELVAHVAEHVARNPDTTKLRVISDFHATCVVDTDGLHWKNSAGNASDFLPCSVDEHGNLTQLKEGDPLLPVIEALKRIQELGITIEFLCGATKEHDTNEAAQQAYSKQLAGLGLKPEKFTFTLTNNKPTHHIGLTNIGLTLIANIGDRTGDFGTLDPNTTRRFKLPNYLY